MRLKEWFLYFRRIRLKVLRRICWKHGILLKFTETFPNKNSYEQQRADIIDSCFNGQANLHFK